MKSIPKPNKRIVDKKFYDAVRQRDGACIWGLLAQDGCKGPLEVHHIVPRGRGGDDILANGITLCQRHHGQAHRHEISQEELKDAVRQFAWR